MLILLLLLNLIIAEDIIYVSPIGRDFEGCGIIDDTCKSIDYSWNNRISLEGIIYIFFGNYNVSFENIDDLDLFKREIDGFNTSGDENNFPVIFPRCNADFWISLTKSQQISLRSVKIKYDHFENASLFAVWDINSCIEIDNCFFTLDNSTVLYKPIFGGENGAIKIISTVFYDINISDVGFVLNNNTKAKYDYSFVNCSFIGLNCVTGERPLLIYGINTDLKFNVTGCEFVNVVVNGGSLRAAIMEFISNDKVVITSSSFTNITSYRSCFIFTASQSDVSYQFTSLTFNNLTCIGMPGAAVCLKYSNAGENTSSAELFVLFDSCSFALCRSEGGFGGGFFNMIFFHYFC
jgi:hypothetical protein